MAATATASAAAEEWRDLGHAKWRDPYAALEDPSSDVFVSALEEEGKLFEAQKSSKRWDFKTLVEAALPFNPAYAQETRVWRRRTVKLQHAQGHRLNVWMYDADGELSYVYRGLSDFGVDDGSDAYYTISDVGDGAELLELKVYRYGVKTAQWSMKPVGPTAAFKDDRIYFLSVENALRYPDVISLLTETGKGKIRHFHEPDKRRQVELFKPANQPDLFVRTSNALSQRLGIIQGIKVKWFTSEPVDSTLFPLTADTYAMNRALVYNGHKYETPSAGAVTAAEPLSDRQFLVATVKKAKPSLHVWDQSKREWKTLYVSAVPAEIMIHSFSSTPAITLTNPAAPNKVFEIQDNDELTHVFTMPEPLRLPYFKHGHAGNGVPYTYVSAVARPKKLLVEAYGAYGISAHMRYPKRWLPWLAHGYAVVTAAPRGGRDDGDEWYDGGRTAQRKSRTFKDTADVIAAVQRRFCISPTRTIFYGRSAGGWLAAAIGLFHSHLVAAIYAEVPYLDVLRTSSNPALPLTQLEYDEFGDPAHKPDDYAVLQTISPVDALSVAGADAPFFLIRTALHDVQVYPYEALKFAKKARSLGWRVVVGVDSDGGHFAAEKDIYDQWATDAAILDKVVAADTQRRRQTRRHAAAHRSRGITRRRTSSRKQSDRTAVSPAAE